MYIWKIDKLEEQLIAGKLEESESFKYLMANLILAAISMIQLPGTNNIDIWNGLMNVLLVVIGLWFVYESNGGKNGSHIIERFISIGWVAFVRLLVLAFIPLGVVLMVIEGVVMGGISKHATLTDSVYIFVCAVIYFIWVAKHVNFVAKQAHA